MVALCAFTKAGLMRESRPICQERIDSSLDKFNIVAASTSSKNSALERTKFFPEIYSFPLKDLGVTLYKKTRYHPFVHVSSFSLGEAGCSRSCRGPSNIGRLGGTVLYQARALGIHGSSRSQARMNREVILFMPSRQMYHKRSDQRFGN